MQLYISLRAVDRSFHTIILKKKIKEYTYLAAIGYGGGGVYEEVFAKLQYDTDVWEKNNETGACSTGIRGHLSRCVGGGDWDTKINDIILNEEYERFDVESEDFYDMSIDDQHIQIDLLNEIRKYINWGYDEETDEEFDFPLLKKDIDLSQFEKFPETESYYNKNWDDDFLEISRSDLWALTLSFPYMVDNYL
jgi:hypothetical protein